jgi:hypothetical protein
LAQSDRFRSIRPGLGCSLAGGLLVLETLIRAFFEPADMALYGGREATVFLGETQDRCRITRTFWAQSLDHMVLSLHSEGHQGTEINEYGTVLKPKVPRQICAMHNYIGVVLGRS